MKQTILKAIEPTITISLFCTGTYSVLTENMSLFIYSTVSTVLLTAYWSIKLLIQRITKRT